MLVEALVGLREFFRDYNHNSRNNNYSFNYTELKKYTFQTSGNPIVPVFISDM